MKKRVSLLLAVCFVLFTVFPGATVIGAERPFALPDGEYEVGVSLLNDLNDNESPGAAFIDPDAKIVVENGKIYAFLTLFESYAWKSLKTQTTQPGSFDDDNFVDVEIVSENIEEGSLVVKFELFDVTKPINLKSHIVAGPVDMHFDARFAFSYGNKGGSSASSESENSLADGIYEIILNVLHAEEDKESAMAGYVVNPAQISVKDGKVAAAVTLSGSEMITVFKTEKNGEFVDTMVISKDEEADTRTVVFDVPDLDATLNAKVEVYVAARNHTGKYDVRLAFDRTSIKKQDEATPTQPTKPTKPAFQIPDGTYTATLNVLHAEEDKASTMGRYVTNPVTVEVKDGKVSAAVTLTSSSLITGFQTEKDGELVEAIVISEDKEADTKTVVFEVPDPTANLNAKVQVYFAPQNYTGNHEVRLAFDPKSIKKQVDAADFKDIENSWAKEYIESLVAKNIIQGVSADRFAPKDSVTRAQFAVMLARALDLPMEAYAGTFADVPEGMTWAAQGIEAANRAGIVVGNNGQFDPTTNISREQMAVMIIRAVEYKNASILSNADASAFTDEASISSYAKDYVAYAAGLGIIEGMDAAGGKVFKPADHATREQAAKVIYVLLEKLQ